jgi:hypothetical protein
LESKRVGQSMAVLAIRRLSIYVTLEPFVTPFSSSPISVEPQVISGLQEHTLQPLTD